MPIAGARAMAQAIPGARFVELDGTDHLPFVGDSDAIADEVEMFLTGAVQSSAPERALATVLFTDIVGSTKLAGDLGDARWRELLERHDAIVDGQVDKFTGRVVKHTGDGVLATFDGPARTIRCASALGEALAELDIAIRAGIHTGEIELIGDDIGGIAVHIGARVAALAGPGEVLVSSTAKDLVAGSGVDFANRGEQALKGVTGEWRLYAVSDDQTAPPAPIDDTRAEQLGDRATTAVARHAPWLGRALTRTLVPSARRSRS